MNELTISWNSNNPEDGINIICIGDNEDSVNILKMNINEMRQLALYVNQNMKMIEERIDLLHEEGE
jgi:hypothetical protein